MSKLDNEKKCLEIKKRPDFEEYRETIRRGRHKTDNWIDKTQRTWKQTNRQISTIDNEKKCLEIKKRPDFEEQRQTIRCGRHKTDNWIDKMQYS